MPNSPNESISLRAQSPDRTRQTNGGDCVKILDFGRIGALGLAEFGYVDWRDPVSETHIMFSGLDDAVLVRAKDASVRWSMEFPTKLLKVPPFVVSQDFQEWTIPSTSGYKKTLQQIVMGGGDRIDELTTTRLPDEREDKVKLLKQHRVRLLEKIRTDVSKGKSDK